MICDMYIWWHLQWKDMKSERYISKLVEKYKNLILTNVVIKHFLVRSYSIELKLVVHVEVPVVYLCILFK